MLHVYDLTGGVESHAVPRMGTPAGSNLLDMCSAASDTDVFAKVPDTLDGVAILDFVAPATLRAIDLAHIDLELTVRGYPAP